MATADSTPGKSPAFQFYPKDFLSDEEQAAMSLAEAGMYIRLLCACWNNGSLPNDATRIAKLCGATMAEMRKCWPMVRVKFLPCADDPSRLYNPRMERERRKQEQFKQDKAIAGKRGADKRWHRHGTPIGLPIAGGGSVPIATDNSSSSSSSSSSDFSQRERPLRAVSGGAGVGSNPRDHLYCRGNGTKCGRICVSQKQHAILCAKLGGDERTVDDRMDAFYAEVRARLDPNQAIGDTPWKFWEAQFAAKFGTVTPQNPKTAGNLAAAARFVARGQR